MRSVSRRSFLTIAGFGALSLAGCNAGPSNNSSGGSGSANAPSQVSFPAPNDDPFQVVASTWGYNDTKSSIYISYAVRNNLSDKAVFHCPISVEVLDETGKQLVIKSIDFPVETETMTGFINPGEVAYFDHWYELDEEHYDKVGGVTVEADRHAFFPHFYEPEPFKGELFEVKQDGEVQANEHSLSFYADTTPTAEFKAFAEKYNVESVQTYAIFLNAQGEMVAVASNETTIDDPTKSIHEYIQCHVQPMPEYASIQLCARPELDIEKLEEVPFGDK